MVELLKNSPVNYSMILNRIIDVKINDEVQIKMNAEIFVFQDDDGNFKLDLNLTPNSISGIKKITNYHTIAEYTNEYKRKNSIDIIQIAEKQIMNFYKKFKNQQIKELVKEHNICLL